jgi:integrase
LRPPVTLEDGSSFIIRQDNGEPIDPDNWTKDVWPTVRTTAKLPETVTVHALRHTFGSLLLDAGVPVKHVSEQMGHASPTITMQVYQHILRATSATATRQLDKLIPGAPKRKSSLRLIARGAA